VTLSLRTAIRSCNFMCGKLHGKIESPQVNTWLDHYSFIHIIHAPFLNKDAADADDVPQDLARGMAIYSATRLQQHDGQHTVALMTIPSCGILRMRSPRP